MKIEVLYNWGDATHSARRIEPGIYEDSDPRLFGNADYLVTNGHARVIADELEIVDLEGGDGNVGKIEIPRTESHPRSPGRPKSRR